MKQIIVLIFIILIAISQNQNVQAAIVVQNNGTTVVSQTQISRPINVTLTGLLNLSVNLNVKALDQYVTNTSNSSFRFPVSQLYLNDGSNSYQMQYNTAVTLLSGITISLGSYTKPYTALVTNVSALPPGDYTTRLQFDVNSLLPTQSTTFTMTFTIPVDQSVSTITNPVNITLTSDNVFDTSANIANTVSPQVNLKSNSKWKLILDTTSLGTLYGDYYFQVLNGTSHVTSYTSTPTKIQANQQYTIARGTGTYSAPITGTYTNDYVTLKYYMLNNSGTYIQEGSYNNYVKYSLQQDTD